MPAYIPTLYDSPALAKYSLNTGPIIGLGPRAAYQLVGRFINPDTGKACVNLETLAEMLETSTSTVSRHLQAAADSGLLVKEPQPASNGHTYNVYFYDRGFAAGWLPDYKPTLGKQTIAAHRAKEMTRQRSEIEELAGGTGAAEGMRSGHW